MSEHIGKSRRKPLKLFMVIKMVSAAYRKEKGLFRVIQITFELTYKVKVRKNTNQHIAF